MPHRGRALDDDGVRAALDHDATTEVGRRVLRDGRAVEHEGASAHEHAATRLLGGVLAHGRARERRVAAREHAGASRVGGVLADDGAVDGHAAVRRHAAAEAGRVLLDRAVGKGRARVHAGVDGATLGARVVGRKHARRELGRALVVEGAATRIGAVARDGGPGDGEQAALVEDAPAVGPARVSGDGATGHGHDAAHVQAAAKVVGVVVGDGGVVDDDRPVAAQAAAPTRGVVGDGAAVQRELPVAVVDGATLVARDVCLDDAVGERRVALVVDGAATPLGGLVAHDDDIRDVDGPVAVDEDRAARLGLVLRDHAAAHDEGAVHVEGAALVLGSVADEGAALDVAGAALVDVDGAAVLGVAARHATRARTVLNGERGAIHKLEDVAVLIGLVEVAVERMAAQVHDHALAVKQQAVVVLRCGDVAAQANHLVAVGLVVDGVLKRLPVADRDHVRALREVELAVADHEAVGRLVVGEDLQRHIGAAADGEVGGERTAGRLRDEVDARVGGKRVVHVGGDVRGQQEVGALRGDVVQHPHGAVHVQPRRCRREDASAASRGVVARDLAAVQPGHGHLVAGVGEAYAAAVGVRMVLLDGAARHLEDGAGAHEDAAAGLGPVARNVPPEQVELGEVEHDDATAVAVASADPSRSALARIGDVERAVHAEHLACVLVTRAGAVDGVAVEIDGDGLAGGDLERDVLGRSLPVAIEHEGSAVSRLVDQPLEHGPVGGDELGLALGGRDGPHAGRGQEERGGIDAGLVRREVDRELARSALEPHADLGALDGIDHVEALVARHEEVVEVVAGDAHLAGDAHVVGVPGDVDAAALQRAGVAGDRKVGRPSQQP